MYSSVVSVSALLWHFFNAKLLDTLLDKHDNVLAQKGNWIRHTTLESRSRGVQSQLLAQKTVI